MDLVKEKELKPDTGLAVWCPFVERFANVGGKIIDKPDNFRMCLGDCPLARKNRVEGALIENGKVKACTKNGSVMDRNEDNSERDEDIYE